MLWRKLLKDCLHVLQSPSLIQFIVQALFFDLLCQKVAHISSQEHNLLEERFQQRQDCALHVVVPRLHPDAVGGRCEVKVFSQIVDYNCSRKISTEVL